MSGQPGPASCLLCRQPAPVLHGDMQDRICGAAGAWSIRRCAACDLAWLEGTTPAEAYGDGYYTHGVPLEKLHAQAVLPPSAAASLARGLGYPLDRAATFTSKVLSLLPLWRDRCESIAMYLPARPGGRLLDVGAATGVFGAIMRSLGWDVTCVEPDVHSAALSQEAFGHTVCIGTLHDAALPAGSFDAVTLSHVIEHVPDPLATLQEVARVLRPGGSTVVLTPNLRSVGSRLFGRHWMHWDVPRHRYIFSVRSLAEVARRAGLQPVQARTTARAARWAWRRSRELRTGGVIVETGSTRSRGADAVAFELLESALLPWTDAGEECVLVARVRHEHP
jgi:SAM-dependent methyltransferase